MYYKISFIKLAKNCMYRLPELNICTNTVSANISMSTKCKEKTCPLLKNIETCPCKQYRNMADEITDIRNRY